MSDQPLRVHGVPEPKGTSWLKEVRLEAARNTIETLRRQREAQDFQQAKARGVTTEEIVAKGIEDLQPTAEAPVTPEADEPVTEKGKK